jgi:GNAT superfamily N-acetyltransferase
MNAFPIRRAQPADIPFLADVMYQSMLPGVGRGAFDSQLDGTGVTPLEFHEALLREGANNWGQVEDFLVVEDSAGRPAGAMASFLSNQGDLRPLRPDGFEAVSHSLGWSPEVAKAFWRKYVSVFGLFGKSPNLFHPADYVLEYVAIREDMRGAGLYGKLVLAHAARAREEGHSIISSTGIFGNSSVLRCFEKLGFRAHTTMGPERFRGLYPGLTRFVLDI